MERVTYFLVLFSAFSQLSFSQIRKTTFSEIRSSYEKKNIDDSSAMPEVRRYIQKAKSESSFSRLIQGYRDGRQFDYAHKTEYADSAIYASIRYGNSDDLSKDYLSKGIIYYFYKKNYRQALTEYLTAYQYSKTSADQYLKHKILYHLGTVKSHLGYYQEALIHFQKCIDFYGEKMDEPLHSNEIYNYKKAYFNSLHQLTVINRYLKNFEKSDSLSQLGYTITLNDKDFVLENSYFLKCIGISKYNQKDYRAARYDLERSLPAIIRRNDFAWASVVYFYLGKTDMVQRKASHAMIYFEKIDSIFNKEGFLIPEVYPTYQYLINFNRLEKNINRQLYYTNQLIKADSVINKDYPYLSAKIHRDYDRSILIDEKQILEKTSSRKIRIGQILILSVSLMLAFFIHRYQKERKTRKRYELLQKKMQDHSLITVNDEAEVNDSTEMRKTSLSPLLTKEIRQKLHKFESELMFIKKGLTEKSVAVKLGTNSHYLSIYINENKGMNFNKYMAELRIHYITKLLNSDPKYLNYRIEALAEECGIAARQNFSSLFVEINGIRPADYIKNRKKDLGIS